jgi:molecular chaperone DnaK
MVEIRNKADNLIHHAKKTLHDLEEKVEAGEKKEIEDAIADLHKLMEGEDRATIEAKTEHLSDLAGKLSERLYAQTGAEGGAGPGGEGHAHGGEGHGGHESGGSTHGGHTHDNVVDADFEEVKDDKK